MDKGKFSNGVIVFICKMIGIVLYLHLYGRVLAYGWNSLAVSLLDAPIASYKQAFVVFVVFVIAQILTSRARVNDKKTDLFDDCLMAILTPIACALGTFFIVFVCNLLLGGFS